MRVIISARLLKSKIAQPREQPFDLPDTRLKGFILRVQPSGFRAYYCQTGRGKRVKLGVEGELTPDQARERCEKVLGNVAHDRPPMEGIAGGETALTLRAFMTDTHEPWVRAHQKRASATIEIIEHHFGKWYDEPLTAITVERLERWKVAQLAAGKKPATVDRYLQPLSGVLTRAWKLGKLAENPARRVQRVKIDRSPKIRYLSADEERRLLAALDARDAKKREERDSANAWRKERRRELLPVLPHYGDHLSPAVLLSLHTGLRRGELLSLTWEDVDEEQKQLTVRGDIAKSSQTRHVPLNDAALLVLKRWHEQAPDPVRVFPFSTTFKSAWVELLKAAKITRFRWHDMRHSFASRLVQRNVALPAVQKLLGHESMTMTLRYAHLAPEQLREAVDKLVTP